MTTSVAVDPVRCAAHGLCALVLEERISLDEWGFPVVDSAPLESARLVRRARRAARACPRRALLVSTAPERRSTSTVGT
jgi:ferredoxin